MHVTEILLKVSLNTINLNLEFHCHFIFISELFNDYNINNIGVIFGLGIIRFFGVTNNRVHRVIVI